MEGAAAPAEATRVDDRSDPMGAMDEPVRPLAGLEKESLSELEVSTSAPY